MYRTLSPGAIDVSVSFEEGAQLAARYGFEGLALDSVFLLENGPEAVRTILAKYNLRPGSFGHQQLVQDRSRPVHARPPR